MRRALAGILLGLLSAPGAAQASSGAMELVSQARAHERAHEELVALRRYSDALVLDPTLVEAYLGLGALRLRLGDAREAERVYSVALARAPSLVAALRGRAEARHALGELTGAERDLEEAVARTPREGEDDGDLAPVLRALAGLYGEDHQGPAQLSAWRRLQELARHANDPALEREARATVRALELLVDQADPVINGRDARTPGAATRRALAAIARRGG